jgi:cytoskeletal protein RodZ
LFPSFSLFLLLSWHPLLVFLLTFQCQLYYQLQQLENHVINQSPGKSKDKTDSSPKSRSNKTSSPSRSSRPSNKGKESITCDNTTSDVHSSSKYTGNKDKDRDTSPSKPIGGKRRSKDSPNKTENKTRDINEIRREIELEVQKSQIEHEKSFEHEQNESLMKEEKKYIFISFSLNLDIRQQCFLQVINVRFYVGLNQFCYL